MVKNNMGTKVSGGLFLVIGLGMFAFLVLWPLAQSATMLTWQATSATLISNSVESHQSRDSDGNWETYYKPVISYQFQFSAGNYYGNRLEISTHSTTNSRRAYDRLYKVTSTRPFSVWVNPNDPQQSIFDRSPQWRLLTSLSCFTLLFAFVGASIMRMGNKRTQLESTKLFSNEPSKITVLKSVAIGLGLFGGTFAGLLLFSGWWQSFFGLLMLMPAMIVFLIMRSKQQAWRHYQAIELEVEQSIIGGQVSGHIDLPGAPLAGEFYHVTVKCMAQQTSRSGSETRVSQIEKWSTKQKIQPQTLGLYARLSFAIKVPAHLPESQAPAANYCYWQLHFNCQRRGINFVRDYPINVIATQESLTVAQELVAQPLSEQEIASAQASVETHKESKLGEESIEWRTKSDNTGLIFTAAGLLFAAVGLGIVISSDAIMPWAFVLFGLLFAGIGVASKAKNFAVSASPEKLIVQEYFFSTPKKRHCLGLADIDGIEYYEESTGSTNGKANATKFGLRINLAYGQSLAIGGNFESAKIAEYMKQRLLAVLQSEQ